MNNEAIVAIVTPLALALGYGIKALIDWRSRKTTTLAQEADTDIKQYHAWRAAYEEIAADWKTSLATIVSLKKEVMEANDEIDKLRSDLNKFSHRISVLEAELSKHHQS